MKIIYLSNSRFCTPSANALQIVRMCQGFSKVGHSVTLVSPSFPSFQNQTESETLSNVYGLHLFLSL